MAYISLSDTGYVVVYGLDSSYSFNDRVCTWYVNDVQRNSVSLSSGTSFGGGATLSSLNGTCKIRCVISAPSWSYTVPISLVTWSWVISNGGCTHTQVQSAYTAISTKGDLGNFSYEVWNDMVAKVYDIFSQCGYSWRTSYASYNNTLMTSGNKQLTAVRYNALVEQINYMIGMAGLNGTSLPTVNTGDIVYGSFFITLATRINQCMSALA